MEYKLYGIVDGNDIITKVALEFDDITGMTLLENAVDRNRIVTLQVKKSVEGIEGYAYKFVGTPKIVTARTDTEIKSTYKWMNSHRILLTQKVQQRFMIWERLMYSD